MHGEQNLFICRSVVNAMALGILPPNMMLAILLVQSAIVFPLSALMLWLSAKIFKQKVTYAKALLPALVIVIIGLILGIPSIYSDSIVLVLLLAIAGFLISVAFYFTLPRLMLKLPWNKALLTGLLWWVFMIIIGLIITFIIMVIIFSFGAAQLAA